MQGNPLNSAGSLDAASSISISTPGGVQLRDVVVNLGDSDNDTDDNEVSPGPAAWWAFRYVPFDNLLLSIIIYIFHLFREQTRLLRFSLACKPTLALQHRDICSHSDEVCSSFVTLCNY